MVQDPYKVLGVSPGASKDEIKKAYRKKTKECHPDLHPDDPNATKKMSELNEAYDMLMNPEKYAKRSQQETQQDSRYNQGGYQRSYQGGYSQGQNRSGRYQGAGGWSSDFSGFDFGDIFGFGFGGNEQIPNPQAQPGDSSEIRKAIDAINQRQYQSAINTLNTIVSGKRNGRWYYLSSMANNGAGNTVLALEQIQKAVQLEPENVDYQKVLQRFRQTRENYQQAGRGFSMNPHSMQKYCMGMCLANLFCRFCCGGL